MFCKQNEHGYRHQCSPHLRLVYLLEIRGQLIAERRRLHVRAVREVRAARLNSAFRCYDDGWMVICEFVQMRLGQTKNT